MMGWPGPVTHRQYHLWCVWYRLEYDVPTRTDFYLAYIALEVIRGRAKHPNSVRMSHVLDALKFNKDPDEGDGSGSSLTVEQATQLSQSKWLAFMGSASHLAVVHKTMNPDDPAESYGPQPIRIGGESSSSSFPEKQNKVIRKGR